MNNQDWHAGSGWRGAVEDCIIHFLGSNPLRSMEFKTRDINDNYRDKLQEIFTDNSAIEETVIATLNRMSDDYDQIEKIGTGRYKVVEGEYLFRLVKLARYYEQKMQAMAQILA